MSEKKCRRKWRHEHLGGEKERWVKVFSRPGYGSAENLRAAVTETHRFVTIPDDGSICDRYVPRFDPHPIGLRPVIHKKKDPIGKLGNARKRR